MLPLVATLVAVATRRDDVVGAVRAAIHPSDEMLGGAFESSRLGLMEAVAGCERDQVAQVHEYAAVVAAMVLGQIGAIAV